MDSKVQSQKTKDQKTKNRILALIIILLLLLLLFMLYSGFGGNKEIRCVCDTSSNRSSGFEYTVSPPSSSTPSTPPSVPVLPGGDGERSIPEIASLELYDYNYDNDNTLRVILTMDDPKKTFSTVFAQYNQLNSDFTGRMSADFTDFDAANGKYLVSIHPNDSHPNDPLNNIKDFNNFNFKIYIDIQEGVSRGAHYPFESGTGASNNPFVLQNIVQLDALRYYTGESGNNASGRYFILSQTMTLPNDWNMGTNGGATPHNRGLSPIDPEKGWVSIGVAKQKGDATLSFDHENSRLFQGNLDGQNHTLLNFHSTPSNNNTISSNNGGLFGGTNGSTIQNLVLDNMTIDGTDLNNMSYIGTLAGYSLETNFTNILVKNSTVKGGTFVGGLVGKAEPIDSAAENIQIQAEIIGNKSDIGGIVGYSKNLSIKQSNFTGNVSGKDTGFEVGGLAGSFHNATIESSHAVGNITAVGVSTGGLTGKASDSVHINNSTFTGNVSSNTHSIGGISGTFINQSTIFNSHAIPGKKSVTDESINGKYFKELNGSFDGTMDGRVIGKIDGEFNGSYDGKFNGTVNGKMNGKFNGTVNGIPKNEFINQDFSNALVDGTWTGKINGTMNAVLEGNINTTDSGEKMKGHIDIHANGLLNGFFTGNKSDGLVNSSAERVGGLVGNGSKIEIEKSSSMMDVKGNGIGGLVGTLEGNITDSNYRGMITSTAGAGGIANSISNGNIKNSNSYVVIVVNQNGGIFAGSVTNSIIENSTARGEISGGMRLGGFAGTSNNSTIKDSKAWAEVNGTNRNTSGGVGELNNSTVDNFYFEGTIDGLYNIGGIAGVMTNSTIEKSYSAGDVSGTSYSVGGLAGMITNSTIEKSYSAGDVAGKNCTGGIVGNMTLNASSDTKNEILNCYSTGKVSGTNYTGGIVGYAYANSTTYTEVYNNISKCYATGDINGTINYIGGIAGQVNENGSIQNCVALNSIVKVDTGFDKNVSRIYGNVQGNGNSFSGNYAYENMVRTGGLSLNAIVNEKDGENISKDTAKSMAFYNTKLQWSFGLDPTWKMGDITYPLPVLTWQDETAYPTNPPAWL
ncbi:hypothetical protein [Methanolapillus ohkumae]|uniref:GLUG domain-containing protein n=1 Tax=Methanolapillus ohkumae TaxID=3028298 RepID=A0AA96V6R2_9EURY|nr:hypothetical protein MsAm2_03320 [Methanosarcinaceae archaeon Am2]